MNGSDKNGSLSSDLRGKQLFHITPVMLGGSPTDPANKVVMPIEEHIQAVRFWNDIIAQHRAQHGS
jgi:hypothetical protein